MRIVQISTADVGGGAEQVAYNLYREYDRRGHESTLVVGDARRGEPGIVELDSLPYRSAWARTGIALSDRLRPLVGRVRGAERLRLTVRGAAEPARTLGRRLGREDFEFPATRRLLDLVGGPPDVLHAHNLHGATYPSEGYFDLRVLPELSAAGPVVLTLHDAWLLSGHCAHSFDCERWLTGCGTCPDLSIYPAIARDATAYNWRRKRDLYASSRLQVATPCRWLMEKVERSILADAVVEARVIPYGVDSAVFRPGDRLVARRSLGLEPDRRIALVTANVLRTNPWKDIRVLRAALEVAAGEDVLVIALGDSGGEEQVGRARLRFVPQQSQERVAEYLRAADVYLHPARVDTFPNAVLEALACGTPVVATRVGGIPEQVRDGETGLLVPPGDGRAFGEALLALLDDPERRRSMGDRAASDAAARFQLERQADEYLSWYAELADEKLREAAPATL